MKTCLRKWLTGTMLAASGLMGVANGAVTNTVSWSDSFESYASGTFIAGTNGWTSQSASGGVVTNDVMRVNLLTNYPVAGRSFPLPEPPVVGVRISVLSATATPFGPVTPRTRSIA